MEIGLVNRINIEEEMQQAYLDYAMSVIVARALPDARDGLKPVHRRILYAMYDMGLRPDTPYKKSARIVGEVLGKYHPHGDMAVYEAMARMAQNFSMRYTLVDGQGNFGSVDGDAPAAMRYTEARLASPSMQMLSDIQKNTVDFDPNFDGTLTEPRVLPAAIPNLLVNGATGIAVGMATSIPPHNLGEVIDALHYVLEHWEKMDDVSVEDLMNFVQGPDFPTGGIIIHDQEGEGLVAAYSTGRGRVTVRASAHLEEMERGRSRIIINELPYMTNKASLIERIASLVREEKLEGIADLRDESDRQGMRIVIELSKTANPEAVLADLYKNTPMQTTFSMIMLALVDGEPRLLGLKQALRVFIEHRLEIVRRRSEYDLEKARQRAHILEGLRVALQNLDEVISLIRKSPDAETARERLMKRFRLTTIQAQAILDMPLRRLAALERKKIEDEYKEVLGLIKELEALLRSPKKMRQVIDAELQTIKEIYADRRRTHIVHLKPGEKKITLLTASDLKPDKIVWVSVTPTELISRSLEDRQPRLSGKDAPTWLLQASTRDTLYLLSEQGEASAIPVHALPETDNPTEGLPLARVSALKDGHRLAAVFSIPPRERRMAANGEQNGPVATPDPFTEGYILTVTRQGMVKKSPLSELPGPSASTFTLARVNPGDRLAWARITRGSDEILLVTAKGMAIRFTEDEVRPMGLVAAGVMGIKLQNQDEIAGLEILPAGEHLLMLASDGSAKRVPMDQFSRQGRYGQGIIAWRLPNQVRLVGVVAGKSTTRLIIHLARLAPKTIQFSDAPVMGRTARGQVIQELKEKDQILGICVPIARFSSLEEQPSLAKPKAKSAARAVRSSSAAAQSSARSKIDGEAPAKVGQEPSSKTRKKASSAKTTATTTPKTGRTAKVPAEKPAPKKVTAATVKPSAAKTPSSAPAAKQKTASATQPSTTKPTSARKTAPAAQTTTPKATAKQKTASATQPTTTKSTSSRKTAPAAQTTTPKATAKQKTAGATQPTTTKSPSARKTTPAAQTTTPKSTAKKTTTQSQPAKTKSPSTEKTPAAAQKSTPKGKPAAEKTPSTKTSTGAVSSETVVKPGEKPKRSTTKKTT